MFEPLVPEISPEAAPTEPISVPRKRRYALWGGIMVVCVFFAPLIAGGVVTGFGLRTVYTQLKLVQQAATEQKVLDARTAITKTNAALVWVDRGQKMMLFWRYMPIVRPYLATLQDSVGAARSTLQGVSELIDVAELVQQALAQVGIGANNLQNPLAGNRTFRDLSSDEKRQILGRIASALPAIRTAQEQMRIALTHWQNVPKEGLAQPLRDQLEQRIAQFQAIQSQFDEAMRLAEVFLPISGYDAPKKYLIILQNNQEMRATGGFIGNIGEIWIDAGDIQKMTFQDVYSIDNPVAKTWTNPSPAPIAHWLEQKNLFLRDANWSPDVPQSAQTLLDQYTQELSLASSSTVPDLDGVILLEPDFFRSLMKVIGPVQVESQTFTTENFFDQLEYDLEISFVSQGIPIAQRKEIVSKLGDALFQKLISLPSHQWPELLNIATDSLAQKDILLYMRDQHIQSLLDARDWSGRAKAASADYLWVVDSNLDAWKTDGVMDKKVEYSLDATNPDDVRATVTLHYTNTNTKPDWRYIHYRDYARVYVPEGSELISSSGAMDNDLIRTHNQFIPGQVDVYKDLGKTVFGAFFSIEPGKTGELQFVYRLPPYVAEQIRSGHYNLLVQKQPGSYAQVVMDAQFPRALTGASPAEDSLRTGDDRYQKTLTLTADTQISVQW